MHGFLALEELHAGLVVALADVNQSQVTAAPAKGHRLLKLGTLVIVSGPDGDGVADGQVVVFVDGDGVEVVIEEVWGRVHQVLAAAALRGSLIPEDAAYLLPLGYSLVHDWSSLTSFPAVKGRCVEVRLLRRIFLALYVTCIVL